MRTDIEIKSEIANELRKAESAQEEIRGLRKAKEQLTDKLAMEELQNEIEDLYSYESACYTRVYCLEWVLGDR